MKNEFVVIFPHVPLNFIRLKTQTILMKPLKYILLKLSELAFKPTKLRSLEALKVVEEGKIL